MNAIDESVLDDAQARTALDQSDMLRAVASAGAQVRIASTACAEAGLAVRVAADGRPRAVVLAGMGGSGIAGESVAALCGASSPAPVLASHGYTLPAWVGSVDLVIAVSCSGTTEETLAVVEEAVRRGARLLTIGPPGSPLAALSEQARGIHLPVSNGGRLPRANMWALTVPAVIAVHALGLVVVPAGVLERTADRLDAIAEHCRPSSEAFMNPAKSLALDLAGYVPMVWGGGSVAAVAAYRFGCQLNENSKLPAVIGVLPEANHNQVVALDGRFGRLASSSEDPNADLFRDRLEEPDAGRLRLVLMRDRGEHPQVARRATASIELAADRGVPVNELVAEGEHPLEQLASLVGLGDFASVYLALLHGIDPTPIAAIAELKERIVR
ncbi:MAG: SIS domain-containing protein [Actinomycetes bacterium]|jgi:glucose/mannose-6-phosphate isomerase